MENLEIYFVVGVLAVLLIIVVIGWLYSRTRRGSLGDLPAEAEADVSMNERINAPRSDMFSAAPFAEQIEDMVRTELALQPGHGFHDVEFGTAEDGSLQIKVNGRTYIEIKEIPEEPIRAAIAKAISTYSKG